MDDSTLLNTLYNDSKTQQYVWGKYYNQMYAYSLKYTNNVEDTEDILGESFMMLFNKCGNIQNNNIKSYLMSIVRNNSINKLRSKKIKYEYDVDEFKDSISYIDHQFTNLEYKYLLNKVEHLPPGYKDVFTKYVLEGKSHKTISQELNITEGTCRSQLSKARKFLAKKLEGIL